MRGTARFGALSIIVFAVGGIAWFALELAPPSLGLARTARSYAPAEARTPTPIGHETPVPLAGQ